MQAELPHRSLIAFMLAGQKDPLWQASLHWHTLDVKNPREKWKLQTHNKTSMKINLCTKNAWYSLTELLEWGISRTLSQRHLSELQHSRRIQSEEYFWMENALAHLAGRIIPLLSDRLLQLFFYASRHTTGGGEWKKTRRMCSPDLHFKVTVENIQHFWMVYAY